MVTNFLLRCHLHNPLISFLYIVDLIMPIDIPRHRLSFWQVKMTEGIFLSTAKVLQNSIFGTVKLIEWYN